MPELNFNLLAPSSELYSGPQVKLDPQAAYDAAQAQQQTNMLSQLYAKHYDPQTGGINYNSLIGEAAQNPLTARAIPKIMEGAQSQAQSMAEIAQKRALQQQETATAEAKQQELKQAKIKEMAGDSYDRLQSVKTPEDFMAWHLANPELEGTNKAERTAKLQAQLAQPGGFEAALKDSTSSLQRILGIEQPKLETQVVTLMKGGKPTEVLINKNTGEPIKELGEGKVTTGTSVNVGVSTAKGIAENVGDIAKTSRTQAVGALKTMDSANNIRQALNSGLVIAGPAANLEMKFNQLLTEAGKGNPEKAKQLQQTRTAIINLSKLTLAARAELQGSGAISDFETKLLEKAQSGDISDMSVEELQTVVDAAQKGSQFLWNEHQGLLDTMKSDPETAKLARYYTPTAKMPVAIGRTNKPSDNKPANVPSNWTLQVDSKGNKAYVSPDKKQHVEVK